METVEHCSRAKFRASGGLARRVSTTFNLSLHEEGRIEALRRLGSVSYLRLPVRCISDLGTTYCLITLVEENSLTDCLDAAITGNGFGANNWHSGLDDSPFIFRDFRGWLAH